MNIRNKGISDYFSHILALAIAIIVLFLVASTFHEYHIGLSSVHEESEANLVLENIASVSLKLHSEYGESESNGFNGTILAKKKLDLPEKIGGNRYRVSFEDEGDAYIFLDITSLRGETYNKTLYGLDIDLEGSFQSPGDALVEYVAHEDSDLIRIGEAGL